MGTKLISTEELKSMGFKPVFGTTETFAGDKTALVLWGTPLTWGYNNGVAVVYHADAKPWLKRGIDSQDVRKFYESGLPRNAYVPHSNDGGQFVREVLPTL